MKPHLYNGNKWLTTITLLMMQSVALAQSMSVRDEMGRIVSVLNAINFEYFPPIDELKLATGCRDGVLSASNLLLSDIDSQQAKSDINSINSRDLRRQVLNILEMPKNVARARQLSDACIYAVFRQLDERSAYYDQAKLEELRASLRTRQADTAITGRSDTSTVEHRNAQSTQFVVTKLIEDRHLYLRIPRLGENTVEQLGEKLRALDPVVLSKVSDMVLDLRENQGGLLTEAVGVAAAFLHASAPVASTVGRYRESWLAEPKYYMWRGVPPDHLRELPSSIKTIPLFVLVNRQTVSGAEMIAAALQDNRRGTIVGEQTKGYGTVQSFRSLNSDTAFKITTSKFIRPNGDEWNGKGVMPDYFTVHKSSSDVEYGSTDDLELSEVLQRTVEH